MTKDEALKLALEALEANQPVNYCMNNNGERFPMMHEDPFRFERNTKAIIAIKEALAQQNEFNPDWNEKLALTEEVIRLSKRIEELEAQPKHGWTPERIAGMARLKAQQDSRLEPQRILVGLTPACPKGLTEYECEVEGVDLVCFLEYTPDEEGSRDSYGLLNEPGTSENLELVNAYVKGTDVDIGHLLLQYLVDHITTTALEDFKNDDL
jgi:hypothetical protein